MREKLELILAVMRGMDSIYQSTSAWKTKYHVIFSMWQADLKPRLESINLPLDWYDPDMGYEDDVRSFMSAVSQLQEDIQKALLTE